MSAREWKPGDVALVNGRLCLRTTGRTWEHGDPRAFNYHDHEGLDVRPVVVISPEDREQVERLYRIYYDNRPEDQLVEHLVDQMQAALREFAKPTPPKPEEPTGLGAVVEDVDGQMWVRSGRSHDGLLEDNWRGADGGHRGGWWSKWKDIDVTRVLSEGVTEDGA